MMSRQLILFSALCVGSNSTGPGDESANMERAGKEGATIGPAHGSWKRYKSLVISSAI